MSDLISREALLKVIRDDRLTNASDAIYFITNAPAIEQGEAVVWYREMPMEYAGNCIEHINEKGEAVYIDFSMSTPPANKGWIPLYAAPQQAIPSGYALVPHRLNKAMDRVLSEDDWQWEDLLAAANAITEQEYQDISTASPTAPIESDK